jgi:hypothetical protein
VLAFLTDLAPDEQRLALELWASFPNVDSTATLAFGFDQIIQGLETLVGKAKAGRS